MKLCCINGCKQPACTANDLEEGKPPMPIPHTGAPLNHGMCLLHLSSTPRDVRLRWAAARSQGKLDALFRDIRAREWAPAEKPLPNPYAEAAAWSTT